MTQTPERGQALDLLPAIGESKPEIFIKSIDDMAISWSAFLNPFVDYVGCCGSNHILLLYHD